MDSLIKTVAKALCAEDLKDGFRNFSDEEFKAFEFFMKKLQTQLPGMSHEEKKYFFTLNELHAKEDRPKAIIFKCSINNDGTSRDITEDYWRDYKDYAETAITAYDKWLDIRTSNVGGKE